MIGSRGISMTINEGSLILIDYVARIKEGDEEKVFDTTLEDVARDESIFDKNKIYEPILVVIGQNWVPIGLEKALMKANVGDEFDIIVPCEEAYGPKDPSKIKLVARREFQKLNINPSVGERIYIGGQIGSVLSVSSSRVRMDYNHLLAGKDIGYKVKIHKKITNKEEKIKALLKRRLPGSNLDNLDVKFNGDQITIIVPEDIRYLEYLQFAKKELVEDINVIIGHFSKVTYIEVFETNSE